MHRLLRTGGQVYMRESVEAEGLHYRQSCLFWIKTKIPFQSLKFCFIQNQLSSQFLCCRFLTSLFIEYSGLCAAVIQLFLRITLSYFINCNILNLVSETIDEDYSITDLALPILLMVATADELLIFINVYILCVAA